MNSRRWDGIRTLQKFHIGTSQSLAHVGSPVILPSTLIDLPQNQTKQQLLQWRSSADRLSPQRPIHVDKHAVQDRWSFTPFGHACR
jgi:hypothetical protein